MLLVDIVLLVSSLSSASTSRGKGRLTSAALKGRGAGRMWSTRCLVVFLASRLLQPSPESPHAPLQQERLRKGGFGHAPDTGGSRFNGWVVQERLLNGVGTRAGGREDAVAHAREQEEGTPAQGLGGQHAVGWGRHRIILPL